MNVALKALLTTMLNKRIIGGKHTPEMKIIQSKAKWLSKVEKREFMYEYRAIVSEKLIFRARKRTKKSFDWHISINPRKLKEIYELVS